MEPFEIYSFKDRKADAYIELVKEVTKLVEARFLPDKKFVSHNLMFYHQLTGIVPFNEDINIGTYRTHFFSPI